MSFTDFNYLLFSFYILHIITFFFLCTIVISVLYLYRVQFFMRLFHVNKDQSIGITSTATSTC